MMMSSDDYDRTLCRRVCVFSCVYVWWCASGQRCTMYVMYSGFPPSLCPPSHPSLPSLFSSLTPRPPLPRYEREDITWDPTDFPNNEVCLELIEKKRGGILALLTEECFRGNAATDKGLARKLLQVGMRMHMLVVFI